ncbi:MAG: zf-HC2 domain-containing protein [Phycisphaerae bacterium]
MTDSSTSCPADEIILAHVEGGLSPEQQALTEAHLRACGPCRKRVEEAENLTRVSKLLSQSKLNQRDVERIDRCVQSTLDEVRRTTTKPRD